MERTLSNGNFNIVGTISRADYFSASSGMESSGPENADGGSRLVIRSGAPRSIQVEHSKHLDTDPGRSSPCLGWVHPLSRMEMWSRV
jgi:hypothetical protein